jgi:inner membrane protein
MGRLGLPWPYNEELDNLTHTAIGLFLSRAGLKSWTPRATPILLLAANIPDIDVVSAGGGSLAYLHYHRHLTHSLVAMPVMALMAVGAIRLLSRKPVRWLGAFAAAMIGVATHVLLDWTNTYGIRLLLPFSARWLRLDLVNVFDLWIWAVLLLAVAGPFLGRLVGSEITSGSGKTPHHGRGFAWFALIFVLLYDCGRAALHQRALAILDSRVYQDAAPARVFAGPDAANPWMWRGVVETANFFAVTDVDLHGEFDPTRASIFHKPVADPALDVARRDPNIAGFVEFSQLPIWRIAPAPEPENAKTVEIIDLRFGTPTAPGFLAGAVVTSRLQVIDTYVRFGRPRPR